MAATRRPLFRSVSFLAWRLAEFHSPREHFMVVAPEIVGMQKQKDPAAGLVANPVRVLGG